LLDAFALAALVALKNAKIPKYDEESGRVLYDEHTSQHIPLTKNMPFTMTVHKVGNNILLDPNVEEEEASEARITFSISDGSMINAIQKGNDKELTMDEMMEIIDFVDKRWNDMYPKISKMIEEKSK
jgi:exosome complex component RRP42